MLNNTPYQLAINIGGNIINFTEFWQKDLAIGNIQPSFVTITPSLAITSSSHAQASQLTVQGLVTADGGGDLDGPIPQQAVTTTATGKPVYSATFGWGPSAQVRQYLNLFNPTNSGIIFHIHSARTATADVSHPRAVMLYSSGADLNLANAVSIQSHAGTGTPPISVGHATAVEQAPGIAGLTEIESLDFDNPPTVPKDFVTFPDVYDLYPGGNLTLLMLSGVTGNNVRMTLKWTEDTIVPAITVLGPNMVANAIKNDGNAIGTSIIEATPSGFGVSTIQIYNDGSGGWFVDQSGTYHQIFSFNTSGNALQLGKFNDIAEVLGQLLVDQLLTAVAGLTLTGGKITTPSSGGTPTVSRVQTGFNAVVTTGTIITHNMGVQPNIVLVTPTTLTTFDVTAVGVSTFTIAVGANCNCYWLAIAT